MRDKLIENQSLQSTSYDFSGREWWYGFVTVLGVIGYVSKPEGADAFVAMTAILTVFIGIEIFNRARLNRAFWLLEPAVLASFFTFGLAYGVTNFVYFLPEGQLAPTGLVPVVTPEMNKLMALVIIAATAMWSGFYLPLGEYFGTVIRRLISPILRKRLRISLFWAVVFVFLSVFARFQQISLGVFGYASEYESLFNYAAVREYFDIAVGLGALVLLVLSLTYFDSGRKGLLIGMLGLLVIEILFAFMGGFKGRVLLPIVIVGGAFLVVRRRLPMWLFPSLAVGVMLAYAVIEPFRDMKYSGGGIEATSIAAISSALNEAASGAITRDEYEVAPEWVPVLSRSNLTYIGSQGIAYIDQRGDLPEDSPSFLKDIFLAPLYAVVPRFLWESKPLQMLGLWYTNEVIGLDITSSTGMGPVTYLYFAGGMVAVMIGFAVVGIIQRAIFVGLFNAGGGGIVCYLMLLPTVVLIDSAFNTLFSAILRYGPVYLVCQWLLLRR